MIALLHTLALCAFPALVIVAALRDMTSYTIPNWISLALIAAFAPVALLAGFDLQLGGVALAAGGIGLVAGIAMFALGWIGGGDAKLFAACMLWLGWPASAPFVIWTALAGGGLAVALLWGRRLGQPIADKGPPWFGRLMTPGGDVPYGLSICFGALIAFPESTIAQHAIAAL
jgi:prepilin peptidase CpaA